MGGRADGEWRECNGRKVASRPRLIILASGLGATTVAPTVAHGAARLVDRSVVSSHDVERVCYDILELVYVRYDKCKPEIGSDRSE